MASHCGYRKLLQADAYYGKPLQLLQLLQAMASYCLFFANYRELLQAIAKLLQTIVKLFQAIASHRKLLQATASQRRAIASHCKPV